MNFHEYLRYEDGKLYWIKNTTIIDRVGKEAGTLNCQGYLQIQINKKVYLAHKIVWALHGNPWEDLVDHINMDKTDNRLDNLRASCKHLNGMNRGKNKNNTSGIKGVSFDKSRGKWVGQIKIHGKRHSKRFETKEEAAEWYQTKFEELVSF